VDVSRQYDLKLSEVQGWVEVFLKGGEQNLKTNAPDAQAQFSREVKELKETIGDLYVENAIKKAKALRSDFEERGS
jgi:hypothetical protein